MTARPKDIGERLWSRCERTDSGCLEFRGYRHPKKGYGQIGRGRRSEGLVETHRLAWELTHGPIPAGLVVRHACDNPPCCEPTHLSLGTHQDNSDDKVSRGRQARGPALPHARLSETQVREIRARYTRLKSPPGERGYRSNARDLASEFGVSVGHVRCIVAGTERSNV